MTLLRRRDDGGRADARRAPGRARGHRGPVRRIALRAVAILALVGATAAVTSPALAVGPAVSIAVTSSPNPVSSGQALAYTITVANTGGAAASGLSLTDTLVGLGIGSFPSSPWMTASTGSCSFASPTVTCSAATLSAGGSWSVTITGQVTAAAGGSLSNTATVTGTESSTPFSASATVTTPINQVLPPGFTQTKLAGSLTKPILLAFAPNGDIYVGEQTGVILIYRNGAVLPTPLVTLPNVFYNTECGLLGLALDPNFATNGYVYISYVVNVTNSSGTQPYTRLSRFTVVNNAIDLTTEKVYYQGNQIQNGHHPGQTVKIGPDGKLWWSVGDNVPSITNAQTLTNIYGKMLRFNLDGSVPSDNPFLNVPNAIPYIYAYGLRNPFRWSFLPTGQPMTEDTGSSYWEELDTIQPGGNYGWDFVEGNCGSCGGINPVYAYGHYPVDGAASAVAAYTGTTFPRQYANVVFVGDYNQLSIDAVTFDPTYRTVVSDTVFDSAVGTIADLEEGPDGNLYYASIFSGSIYRISAPGPFAPTATASATPNAGPAPLPVQFSSAGSTDPYGLPLSYSWNFGDGSGLSTAANPSHTYASAGTYTATLTVSNGSQVGTATTQVTVGASPPIVAISAPATYNAGQAVAFSGTATDAVDGAEPPSAYSWKVDFYANGVAQPSFSAEVASPFYGPVTGVTSGSFQVPTDPSQTPTSFYRITLTVTDSLGLQTVVTQDLHPNTTTWTASANVAGAGYAIDGQWVTGPFSTTDVVGVQHVIAGMPLVQAIGGSRYRFAGFADGSTLTDTFTAGSGPGSYTANYEPVTSTMPSSWQSVDVGAPITVGAADYAASSGTFYVDGSGSDVYGANEQFHYVYQALTGDGTITARVRYQSNSSSWAKAGVMVAQSTAAGTAFVDALVAPDVSPNTPNINGVACDANGCISPLPPVTPAMGNGARMQYTGPGGVTPKTYPTGFASPNKWVQLQRSGNTFVSSISADGVNWTQIGVVTLAMTGPVTIGLFDTAHNIGQYSTVAFDHVQVVGVDDPAARTPAHRLDRPGHRRARDHRIGRLHEPHLHGHRRRRRHLRHERPVQLRIRLDELGRHVSARLVTQTNTSSSAKSGVMMRATTDPGSPYYSALYTPGSGVVVQWRNSQGVTTSQSSKVAATLPIYLQDHAIGHEVHGVHLERRRHLDGRARLEREPGGDRGDARGPSRDIAQDERARHGDLRQRQRAGQLPAAQRLLDERQPLERLGRAGCRRRQHHQHRPRLGQRREHQPGGLGPAGGGDGRLQPGERHRRRRLGPDPHRGLGRHARHLPADGHRHGALGHPHDQRQPDRHGSAAQQLLDERQPLERLGRPGCRRRQHHQHRPRLGQRREHQPGGLGPAGGGDGRLQPGERHGRRRLGPDPHRGLGRHARDLPPDGHRHGDLGHPHDQRQPDRHGQHGWRPAVALDRRRHRVSRGRGLGDLRRRRVHRQRLRGRHLQRLGPVQLRLPEP